MNYSDFIEEIQDLFLLPKTNTVSIDTFREQLSVYINELIKNDFNRLINVLYRVDVDETILRELLAASPGQDAGSIIADAIISRQLIKFQYRNNHAERNEESDEERW